MLLVYLYVDASSSPYEQVEELSSASKVIEKIKLVKDAGLYLLDKEMALRVFVDPNKEGQ